MLSAKLHRAHAAHDIYMPLPVLGPRRSLRVRSAAEAKTVNGEMAWADG
jgi:hypothetical protein